MVSKRGCFHELCLSPLLLVSGYFVRTQSCREMETSISSNSELSPEEERLEIRDLIVTAESQTKEGDAFYLITQRWWQHWRDYVNQDLANIANDESSIYGSECNDLASTNTTTKPSAIDNLDLIYDVASEDSSMGMELHDTLVEGRDYVLLPEEVWKQLHIWYGGGPTLVRQVINTSTLAVEVHLLRLRLMMPKGEHAIVRISKKETVRALHERAFEVFYFNVEQICIWDYYGGCKHTLLNELDKTLYDANLQMDQDILVEVIGDCNDTAGGYVQENGSAEKESASILVEPCKSSLSTGKGVSRSCSSEISQSQYLASPVTEGDNSYGVSSVGTRGTSGGLSGLLNLGNTCYMNCAIQCLVHTPEFARYFQDDYHPEINWQNPMGTVGELALAFGELLRKLWVPGRTTISPRPFKIKLTRFSPQFSGYNQHDSQELLAFLLDGLHEDLNRVKDKPYIKSRDADGRADEEVANEYWANHLARNDSIIVDVCQGQYKSTLVCPACSKISVTFDPFMWLSLPLQPTNKRTMTVTVFTSDGSALPRECTVSVPTHGLCRDLIIAVSSFCSLKNSEKLLLAEIRSHLVIRLEDPLVLLSTIKDDSYLAAYKMPKSVKNLIYLELVHRREEKESNGVNSSTVWKPYGVPLVLPISSDDITTRGDFQAMVCKILSPMQRTENMKCSSISGGASLASEDVGSGEPCTNVTTSDSTNKYQNSLKQGIALKLPLRLVDENNACVDISVREDKPIKVPSSSTSFLVYLDWSQKLQEKYDTFYIENLPEVQGPPTKKARSEPLSLYACLEAFLHEEPLKPDDMWYCPQCKESRQASKKLDLWRLPEVLVIHLKRFSYHNKVKTKLETFVNFPIHDFDLTKYVARKKGSQRHLYELYALSNHYGNMGHGHYTASIKVNRRALGDENRWYNFDDSHVTPINEEDVMSPAAYVLFYRRKKSVDASVYNGVHSSAARSRGLAQK